jgi:hypothetical protein
MKYLTEMNFRVNICNLTGVKFLKVIRFTRLLKNTNNHLFEIDYDIENKIVSVYFAVK